MQKTKVKTKKPIHYSEIAISNMVFDIVVDVTEDGIDRMCELANKTKTKYKMAPMFLGNMILHCIRSMQLLHGIKESKTLLKEIVDFSYKNPVDQKTIDFVKENKCKKRR
jgi:hypothetical protein